jgi:hypothetical protein
LLSTFSGSLLISSAFLWMLCRLKADDRRLFVPSSFGWGFSGVLSFSVVSGLLIVAVLALVVCVGSSFFSTVGFTVSL